MRKPSFWNRSLNNSRKSHKTRGSRQRRSHVRRDVFLGVEWLEDRRLLAAGALDTTFGTGGQVVDDLGVGKDEEIYASAIQADGKLVVAGMVRTPGGSGRDFLIARFNSNGSLDAGFGPGGKFVMNVSDPDTTNLDDQVNDLVVLPDGRILAVGTATKATGPGQDKKGFALVQLTSDGVLDTSFDGDGKLITVLQDLQGNNIASNASSVALQSDGRIVVGGTSTATAASGTRGDFAVARFNPSGTFDTTFDTDGYTIVDVDSSSSGFAVDVLSDIAIQSDGKIVAVGHGDTNDLDNSPNTTQTSQDLVMMRFNTSGSLDTSFSVDGKVVTDVASGSQDFASTVVVQTDGKIVVGGRATISASSSDNDFVIARYIDNGTRDTSFTPSGVLFIPFADNSDFAEDLVIQPDGKYVIGGNIVSSADKSEFGLARVLPSGQLDTSFGTGGRARTQFASTQSIQSGELLLQHDGKIHVAGWVEETGHSSNIAMARFESDLVVRTITGTSTVNEGAPYTLYLWSTDPTTSQWTINWGDGDETVTGNVASVTHVYADGNANYTISATVTATTNTTVPIGSTVSVTVKNVPPTATITGAPTTSPIDTAINLTSTVTDPGASDTHAYVWTVTKDNNSYPVVNNTNAAFTFTPDASGTYVVTLTVTDDDGLDTDNKTITVVENTQPVITTLLFGQAAINENGTAILTGTYHDPDAGDMHTVDIDWDGDGIFDFVGEIVTDGSFMLTHLYADDEPGAASDTISVGVRLKDSEDATATGSASLTVNNLAPMVAVNSATVTVGEGQTATNGGTFADVAGDTVSLTATFGTVVKNVDGTWSWSAATGDGPSTQTVTVTASDEDSGSASVNFTLTVNNLAPMVAVNSATVTVGEGQTATNGGTFADVAGDTVFLTATFGTVVKNVDGTWSWSAATGDGPSTQTVTVTASDEDGGSASVNFTLTVNNLAPMVAVNGATVTVGEGQTATNGGTFADVAGDTVFLTATFGTWSRTLMAPGAGLPRPATARRRRR